MNSHKLRNTNLKQRTRKLVGTVVLMIFLLVYAFAAMMVAIALQVRASISVEVAYYIVAGLAWVLPAGVIIWWMEQPDRDIPPEQRS